MTLFRMTALAFTVALLSACSGDDPIDGTGTGTGRGAAVKGTHTPLTASPPPEPSKGIDGLLKSSDRLFRDVVPIPKVAVRRDSGTSPTMEMYDVRGPYADVVKFYEHHLPDASWEKHERTATLKIAPPGELVFKVTLSEIAFDKNRLVLMERPRYAGGPDSPFTAAP